MRFVKKLVFLGNVCYKMVSSLNCAKAKVAKLKTGFLYKCALRLLFEGGLLDLKPLMLRGF